MSDGQSPWAGCSQVDMATREAWLVRLKKMSKQVSWDLQTSGKLGAKALILDFLVYTLYLIGSVLCTFDVCNVGLC